MSPLVIAAIIMAATFFCFFHPRVNNIIVALTAALAFGLTGIIDVNSIFSNFISGTCILMISMMVIGGAMFETGLGGWVGNRLIRLTGTRTGRLQFAVFGVTFILASMLTGTAALMVMYPLMCSLCISTKKSMSELVMFQMAGSTAGSWLTFAGAGMIGTSAGILEAAGYRTWSFFEIAWYGVPRLLLVLPLICFFMNRFVIRDAKYTLPDESVTREAGEGPDKLSPKMITVLVILLLTLASFVVSAHGLPIHVCAMMGALACGITGCITPKKAYTHINWDTIMLIGGMSTFAKGMQASGFGQLIADSILKITGADAAPMLIVFLLMIVTGIITQFMSDNAAVAMTAPIAIMLAVTQGMEPYAYVMACLIGCSLCHLSIMASPSMAFSMNIAGYEPKHFVRWGLIIELPSAFLAGMIMIPLIWL